MWEFTRSVWLGPKVWTSSTATRPANNSHITVLIFLFIIGQSSQRIKIDEELSSFGLANIKRNEENSVTRAAAKRIRNVMTRPKNHILAYAWLAALAHEAVRLLRVRDCVHREWFVITRPFHGTQSLITSFYIFSYSRTESPQNKKRKKLNSVLDNKKNKYKKKSLRSVIL